MTAPPHPDIRRPGDVNADWLTAVLQEGGLDAVVKRFSAANVGTGQLGESVRFTLDYTRTATDAPASLVGKFPSSSEQSRQTGAALGNYLREVRFYQQLAPGALIHTPRCYFADVDEETSEFVLMMEDLAPAEQGDQLKGVSLEQARLVVIEAARLHASHWGDDTLNELPWVSNSSTAPPSMATEERVAALWRGFKERYGPRLRSHWVEAGDWLSTHFGSLGAQHDGPRCLTHNDFRPDNMMFASAGGGHPVTVLDWQSFAYGAGPTDLAYFLAGALPAEVRRKHEPAFLAIYHQTLFDLGVTGYGMDDLKRHYGQGGYLLFLTAFFASMIVIQTPRGDEMFLRMVGSAVDHMLDHSAVG
jgi:hypothetical protein